MAANSHLRQRGAASAGAADLASMPPLANGTHPPKMSRGLRELIGLSDGSGIQVGVSRTRQAGVKPVGSDGNGEASGTSAPSGKVPSIRLPPASQLVVSSSRVGKTAASKDKHEAVDSPPERPMDAVPPGEELAAILTTAEPGAAPDTAREMGLSADEVSDMAAHAVADAAELVATTAPAAPAPPLHNGRTTVSQPAGMPPAAPSAASSPRRSQRTGVVEAAEPAMQQTSGVPAPPPSPQRSKSSAGAAPLPPCSPPRSHRSAVAAAPASPQRSVRSAAQHASAAIAANAAGLPPLDDPGQFMHADDDMSDVTDACAVPRAARSNLDRRPASSLLGALAMTHFTATISLSAMAVL